MGSARLVCSHTRPQHWHSDHSGGILTALTLIQQQREGCDVQKHVTVDLHPDRPAARAIWPIGHEKPICRLPEDPTFEQIENLGGTVAKNDQAQAVAGSSTYVSGRIERATDFETGLIGGCQWIDGKWNNSEDSPGRLIMDERYLAIDVRDRGLVVFSSCSRKCSLTSTVNFANSPEQTQA